MEKYNLIFLRSNKLLLSRKQYSDWWEIQAEYEDYMASVNFETLDQIEDYIKMDYKISSEKAKQEVNKIVSTLDESVEIDV